MNSNIVILSKDNDSNEFQVIDTLPWNTPSDEFPPDGKYRRYLSFSDYGSNGNPSSSLRRGDDDDDEMIEEDALVIESSSALNHHNRFLQQSTSDNAELEQQQQDEEDEIYYARECSCLEPEYATVYCPFAATTCNRPYSSSGIRYPGCLRSNDESNSRNRNRFLYILALYPILTMCIFMTTCGRYSISYILSWLPGWNKYRVEHMMEHNPRQASGLIRNYIFRNQRILERRIQRERRREERLAQQNVDANGTEATNNANNNTTNENNNANNNAEEEEIKQQRPTSLVLRTSIYQSALKKQSSLRSILSDTSDHTAGNGNSNNNNPTCTICFINIEDQERIGLLSCEHYFHVECLKQWLQRRNTCPLCQKQNIAAPQYDDDDKDEGGVDPETTTTVEN